MSRSELIRNPVLPGSHPDPSIVRVGDRYIVATSTFEWFPGIRLHWSSDLVHCELLGHALTDPDHLSLLGVPDSGGIWAPSLSHAHGRFWLVYAVVRSSAGPAIDLTVFLSSADDPGGPWSRPIHLDSRGFDPSLFHDVDGRTYLLNVRWDHRSDHPSFAGIHLQELDRDAGRLIGTPRRILEPDGLREGPNLYRFGDRYHLMVAEGGTGWDHGIRMARSDDLAGPWVIDPEPLLTTCDRPVVDGELHKAGHGELVETSSGEIYLVHLASRPVATPAGPMSILGRETYLQKVRWDDSGWLRLAQGGHHPDFLVPAPAAPAVSDAPPSAPIRQDSQWVSLRRPVDLTWVDEVSRPGSILLRGQESLHSLFEQSLLACRVTATDFGLQARVELNTLDWSQRAGLVAYYDTVSHAFLYRTVDDDGRTCLGLEVCDGHGQRDEVVLDVDHWPQVHFRVVFAGAELSLFASPDGSGWKPVGEILDAGTLSDDHADRLRFTGAFVGLCAQDLAEHRNWAGFSGIHVWPSTHRGREPTTGARPGAHEPPVARSEPHRPNTARPTPLSHPQGA